MAVQQIQQFMIIYNSTLHKELLHIKLLNCNKNKILKYFLNIKLSQRVRAFLKTFGKISHSNMHKFIAQPRNMVYTNLCMISMHILCAFYVTNQAKNYLICNSGLTLRLTFWVHIWKSTHITSISHHIQTPFPEEYRSSCRGLIRNFP